MSSHRCHSSNLLSPSPSLCPSRQNRRWERGGNYWDEDGIVGLTYACPKVSTTCEGSVSQASMRTLLDHTSGLLSLILLTITPHCAVISLCLGQSLTSIVSSKLFRGRKHILTSDFCLAAHQAQHQLPRRYQRDS
jgi:hypothetical protein